MSKLARNAAIGSGGLALGQVIGGMGLLAPAIGVAVGIPAVVGGGVIAAAGIAAAELSDKSDKSNTPEKYVLKTRMGLSLIDYLRPWESTGFTGTKEECQAEIDRRWDIWMSKGPFGRLFSNHSENEYVYNIVRVF